MAPQTRSLTRRVTRSSTRSRTEATKAASVSRPSASAPKTTRKLKTPSKLKPKAQVKNEPARKRLKRSNEEKGESDFLPTKAPKRVKNKPQFLLTLPVEIFIEIAKYLHPSDLVMLSRANKFFRSLFMSRRSAPIWSSARQSIPDLPPCPGDISEPQYAAMLFTTACSMCGRWAPRNMDPALLVRLCAQCRENETVDPRHVTDSTLVFTTYNLIPRSYARRCLYSDAKAVKAKLNELTAAEDKEAMDDWIRERRKSVQARHQNAQPLRQWLRQRDSARDAELYRVKRARQDEIESRLIELGWDRADLQPYEYWRRKQWQRLVLSTKPLTDRVWNDLLPYLLGHLELNRKQRLERERGMRRGQRERALETWLGSVRGKLAPFAQATPLASVSGPSEPPIPGKADQMILRQPFPGSYEFITWPEVKAFIDDDIPLEQFIDKIEEQRHTLNGLIATWKNSIEARVTEVLPEDTREPDFDSPGFTLVASDGTGQLKPINDLPVDVRKLLRADIMFTVPHLGFYPDDLMNAYTKADRITYHAEAAKIAKALLGVLGRPDAPYLDMKALGRAFQCGRCYRQSEYLTWKDIVEHYLREAREWKSNSGLPRVRLAKNFTYVFTHDVDLVNPAKPLMRVFDDESKVPINYIYNQKICKLCESVRIPYRIHEGFIEDHLREMHMIEEPEQGKHYQ
ncbi:Protein SFI1 [Ceratobasidium theobromae]|uniref:Protein SFI1 n=1 Tax=Ceratobasidium theobromae TaxID=1582974 RepID=A0A5N5QHD0_9AGAM|nr:Protein SFI1 [Ceratobasidium theobromae]